VRLYKIDRNFASFWPQFLGGEPPEFLDMHYKFEPVFDHVAKFRGDRPRDLGDYALEKKKHHEQFIRPRVLPYERPINRKGRPTHILTFNHVTTRFAMPFPIGGPMKPRL